MNAHALSMVTGENTAARAYGLVVLQSNMDGPSSSGQAGAAHAAFLFTILVEMSGSGLFGFPYPNLEIPDWN